MHVKNISSKPKVAKIVDELVASGRYHFTTEQMRSAIGGSSVATRLALGRLAKKV